LVVYGETMTQLDWTGAVSIGVALVLVRLRDRKPGPTYSP
jgi:hypothetical protein